MMRCIVAGGRNITDYSLVKKVIIDAPWKIKELVSGHAKGVDKIGEEWAKVYNIPIKLFIPKWDNLNVTGVVIKSSSDGKKYNAMAGFQRNRKMGEYADVLIAIWDGKSKGTQHMIQVMELLGKPRFIYRTDMKAFFDERWKAIDDPEENLFSREFNRAINEDE